MSTNLMQLSEHLQTTMPTKPQDAQRPLGAWSQNDLEVDDNITVAGSFGSNIV
jgi:hypothetical protein